MGNSLVQNQCIICDGAITDSDMKNCSSCGTVQEAVQAKILVSIDQKRNS